MSQIACSYGITIEQLARLASLASAKQYDGFWHLLHDEAPELSEFVNYSGYVVVVAILFLADRNIRFSNNVSHEAAVRLKQTELAPTVLVDHLEADRAAAAIASVTLTDEELRSFFEEFTGDEWDEAAGAMREAISYLHSVLSEAAEKETWCLVHVG